MAFLGDKNVGDIVKIRENGSAVDFIIIHKGRPSDLYDSSCDGVWLLRKPSHSQTQWGSTSGSAHNYDTSVIHSFLNGDYLNSIDPKIRSAVKTVRIPYTTPVGQYDFEVKSGANGLSCKVFLLSGFEIGMLIDNEDNIYPLDGEPLDYFITSNDISANGRRKDGTNQWWVRTPSNSRYKVWYVNSSGGGNTVDPDEERFVRPAFILPSALLVDSDGYVSTNTLPAITADKKGNLGTLNDGFTCNYSVNDADAADEITATLTLDGAIARQFKPEKGKQYAYSLVDGDWLKITNGTHVFKISATDGKDTVESSATFVRNVNSASITLDTPLEADDLIRACSLAINGFLPTDAVLTCEVTNNGNDAEPVWEDCTIKVKSGMSYVFKNDFAANGFAFNFRVAVRRGASGAGGYILNISGGFE